MRTPTWLLAFLLLATGCRRIPWTSGALPQRGYVWQRAWTPAVGQALQEAAPHLQGVVLLAAEVRVVQGKAVVLRPSIDWAVVQRSRMPRALAVRVAPFAGPYRADDVVGQALTTLAKTLLAEAQAAGVEVHELQLDFDCAQPKLGAYRTWVRALRAAVQPARLVITTLPAWLPEPEFARLIAEADGYVLQVHSVPLQGGARLCDPAQARAWVTAAARLGRPFSVALPTYRCVAGYAPGGKLLGVFMDGVQPAWPSGTRTLEIGAAAEEIAGLVREWQASRPTLLRELIWYRLPVSTDVRNWRWPTLAAVQAGRAPLHRLEVRQHGENPIDLELYNAGEADEALGCTVSARWSGPPPVAADALGGWAVALETGRARFTPAAGAHLRLPPGEKRPMGWLRYETRTPIIVEVAESLSRSP